MSDLPHAPEQCPSASERYLIMCQLVDLLVARESVCPCCVRDILLELADESGQLWQQLNQQHTCMH